MTQRSMNSQLATPTVTFMHERTFLVESAEEMQDDTHPGILIFGETGKFDGKKHASKQMNLASSCVVLSQSTSLSHFSNSNR